MWTGLRWDVPTLTEPYERLTDAVPWAGGYVAVGQVQNNAGGTRAAAWLSPDWHSWTRTLLDQPEAGDSSIWRILPLGPGLVGIGFSGVQHCVPPEGEGQVCDPLPIAVWASSDGRSWQAIPSPAALAGVAVADVASGHRGLLLVGDTGWDRPGVWTSSDGQSWQRVGLPAGLFASAHFSGIAAVADGWVLTGFTGGAEPHGGAGSCGGTPAAWFSVDGVNWARATVDGAAAAAPEAIGRVLVGGGAIIASGGCKSSPGWTSTDGRRWAMRPSQSGAPVLAVAADGVHFIGESFVEPNSVAYWVSLDAVSWQPLAASGAVEQMPVWSAPGAFGDATFLFPTGVGLIGDNQTTRSPLWFAEAVTSP